MEIEKKYLIRFLPEGLEACEKKELEQAYLCERPVVRVRKSNDSYYMTYKSRIGLEEKPEQAARVCNEMEMPLTEEAYLHLRAKADRQVITKTRYLVPLFGGRVAELDIFHGYLSGLKFVEVEFPDEETASGFKKPDWFGLDVTFDKRFSNNYLAGLSAVPDLQDLERK